MSIVTTIVLFCHDEQNFRGEVNAWLQERHYQLLGDLRPLFNGSKAPEIHAYGAAYNMFPDGEFIELVCSRRWEIPEDVLLVVRPQDAPPATYRP